jgi:hypothetical protein
VETAADTHQDSPAGRLPGFADWPALLFLFLASLICAASAILSLQWRLSTNSPYYLYQGFLVDRYHLVPYRDFFIIAQPGTVAINFLVGKVFGYTDQAFHRADFIYASLTLLCTYLWMRHFGKKVAWCAVVLFGLFYFKGGPELSMEPDFLLLLPIALAGFMISSFPNLNPYLRALVVGALLGLSGAIKPFALLAFPLFLLFQVLEARQDAKFSLQKSLLIGLVSICGFGTIYVLMIFCLWLMGALPAYLDIMTKFIPAYATVTNDNSTVTGFGRLMYVLNELLPRSERFHILWGPAVALGTLIALSRSSLSGSQKKQVVLILMLVIAGMLFTAWQGMFYIYKRLETFYFLCLLISLCFAEGPPGTNPLARLTWLADRQKRYRAYVGIITLYIAGVYIIQLLELSADFYKFYCLATIPLAIMSLIEGLLDNQRAQQILAVVLLLIFVRLACYPNGVIFQQLAGQPLAPPDKGRVDEVAQYLLAHLKPGDTVQTMQSAVEPIHVLLISGARPATRFINDLNLYVLAEVPYIQGLRKDYITDLKSSKARYLIKLDCSSPIFLKGIKSLKFPELDDLIASDYVEVVSASRYKIYERRQASAAPAGSSATPADPTPALPLPQASKTSAADQTIANPANKNP